MKIKWFGHSCFLLTSATGIRILLDPFDETVGYKVPFVEADIVTTSHNHHDHCYINSVKGSFIHINQPGEYEQDGVKILGIPVFHDESQGFQRGGNIIFKINVDGLNICHCGDLGHMLSAEQVAKIGDVDILLVPVGGYYTINATTAAHVCRLLNPTLILPMHYKTEVVSYPIVGVENFLEIMGEGQRLNKKEIEVNKENMDQFGKVIILSYK